MKYKVITGDCKFIQKRVNKFLLEGWGVIGYITLAYNTKIDKNIYEARLEK